MVRLDSERNLDNQIAKLLLEINLDREELQQLEQMVLRLVVAAGVADQILRQAGVLDAVLLFAGFAERAVGARNSL